MVVLDYDCLIDSLRRLSDERGRGFYSELQELSGVVNIGRYVTGQKRPNFRTWYKLHVAMPDDIPPPMYRAEAMTPAMQSTGNNNRLVQATHYVEGVQQYSEDLTELMKLLDEYETKRNIKKLLRQYRKVKIEAEKL